MRYAVVAAMLALVSVGQPLAQSPAEPRFEIASIRKHEGQGPRLPVPAAALTSGGVFRGSLTVASLIQAAYGLEDSRVVGGPDWIRQDSFRIDARAGFDASFEQVQPMVRSLLKDRFRLTTHVEQREMRFLALVLARGDGRLGPYIRQLDDPCDPVKAREVRNQFPPREAVAGSFGLIGECDPVSALAALATLASRPGGAVLDMTGSSGRFVYEVRYGSGSRSPTVTQSSLRTSSIETDSRRRTDGLKVGNCRVARRQRPSGNADVVRV
jgi:uncharacterized protein (TIGR03435 family)